MIDRSISIKDHPNLYPLFISALHSQAIQDTVKNSGSIHPYPASIKIWNDVVQAFHEVIDFTEVYFSLQEKSKENTLSRIIRDLLYRIAEYAEILGKKRDFLIDVDKDFKCQKLPRTLDRRLSIQCNHMKHNDSFVGIISGTSRLYNIIGYQIQHTSPVGVEGVDIFHSNRKCYSLNVELRKILFDLYEAGEILGKDVVERFGDPIFLPGGEETVRLIERVCALPIIAFPSEGPSDMPNLSFDGDTFSLSAKGGAVRRPPGSSWSLTATYSGDGLTKKFRVPLI